MFLFAQNALGWQFGVSDHGFCAVDPETAAVESMGMTLDEWANALVQRLEHFTRFGLVHAWQAELGPIPDGFLLTARLPVVRGGNYRTDNFLLVDAFTSMRMRAATANSVRHTGDGEHVGLDRRRFRIAFSRREHTCDCRAQGYADGTWLGHH
ncbi:MAG TPA: hypothetical protein VGF69_09595 [Thermoanaerobaculia bacterium]|jgi:hypothetical protein